ncbi:nuclear transport factor 2 family protein [Corallococcus exiguus]|nr:nuclear transport factor 2 family protein [Stigmatella erecta]NNC19838.1 nuclear transport factor 2 family protein [Corallococcus exiguus]RKH24299.1 nuclear transport factor 2 family protein [Corallococcus sp. CA041A]RKI05062.1 nuclear transport factor 2 family protein [Corallococcus sp. AB038B]RKI06848.1 nuclear transport factor 2 family protein [Corallococcus sp. AB030]RKI45352.1 nuclear transport factor 2 family protein [Corallococcus sp. AB004]RUO90058.1 nuclear transport factor 2 fami
MTMHPSIRAYFDADSATPLHAFAPDAVVEDEGHRHVGHAAIDEWWRDSQVKYQAVAQPIEVNAKDDACEVRAKVTGQFPGSPITLTFAFRMKGDRIAALSIGA